MTTSQLGGRPTQRGFSLLEMLVTIVIVAIGSLGLAGTILTGLRATASSSERTVATQLIASFIEDMNSNVWMKMNTNNVGQGYGAPFGTPLTLPACYPGKCLPADTSTVHLYKFRERVVAALPGGQMRVLATGVNPPLIAVTVAWFEQSAVARTGVSEAGNPSNGCGAIVPPTGTNQCVTIMLPAR